MERKDSPRERSYLALSSLFEDRADAHPRIGDKTNRYRQKKSDETDGLISGYFNPHCFAACGRSSQEGYEHASLLKPGGTGLTRQSLAIPGGTVNFLNLVEGEEAGVGSPSETFAPFIAHYAESFIIPAAASAYAIRPHGPSKANNALRSRHLCEASPDGSSVIAVRRQGTCGILLWNMR